MEQINRTKQFIHGVLKKAAELNGIDFLSCFLNTRKKEIVRVRYQTYYCIREVSKFSLNTIGSYVKGQDHATVLHGSITAQNEYDTNLEYRNTVDKLMYFTRLLYKKYFDKNTIIKKDIFDLILDELKNDNFLHTKINIRTLIKSRNDII